MIAVVALVTSWGPLAILTFALSAGIGVWCMTVYQSAGKKGWHGFLLGFVLTFVFSIRRRWRRALCGVQQKSTKSVKLELLK